jgi:hypothetical protein
MPLMRCNKDNKSGWNFGDSGHCYTGPDARKNAMKQGYMMHKDEWNKAVFSAVENGEMTKAEVAEICRELGMSLIETINVILKIKE